MARLAWALCLAAALAGTSHARDLQPTRTPFAQFWTRSEPDSRGALSPTDPAPVAPQAPAPYPRADAYASYSRPPAAAGTHPPGTQPYGPQRAQTSPDARRPGAQESGVICHRRVVGQRTCYFNDVYYNLDTKRFVMYTDARTAGAFETEIRIEHTATAKRLDSTEEDQPELPFLQLGIWTYRRLDEKEHFYMDFVTDGSPLPATPLACTVTAPTYLLRPYRIDMFGHMLRDNFHSMVVNLAALHRSSTRYDLLLWPTHLDGASDDLHVATKYASYVAGDVKRWTDLRAECAAAAPIGPGPRLLRFRDLVAGWGGYDLRSPEHGEAPCKAENFLAMRDTAYVNNGLVPRSVRALPVFRVLFGDKPLDDKRRVNNIPEVAAYLRMRFPAIEVKALVLSDLPAPDQLRELSTTSVFVSGIGSSSFRLIYLPTGAHTILVGAPEGQVTFPDGSTSQVLPFREAEDCWDSITHVQIDKYHVREPAEYDMRFERAQYKYTNPNKYNNFRVWDADVHLDSTRIGDLVQAAMDSLAPTEV